MAQEKEVRQAPGEYPANQPHILEGDGRGSDQERDKSQGGRVNGGGAESSSEREGGGNRFGDERTH